MRNKQIEDIVRASYSNPTQMKHMLNFFTDREEKPSMKEMSRKWKLNKIMIDELRELKVKETISIDKMNYGQREEFIAKYGLDAFIRHSSDKDAFVELDITKKLRERNDDLLTLMAYEGRTKRVESKVEQLHGELHELLKKHREWDK